MSQTVKIDAAAQDAIAEIVGMPWEKDYFDNTHDKDSAHIATVTREGTENSYLRERCSQTREHPRFLFT